MKRFIKEYILFPSCYGFLPYLIMVFLTGTLYTIYHSTSDYKAIYYALMIIFLILFRSSYAPSSSNRFIILSQLIIASIFAMSLGEGSLFIFITWQAAFMMIDRKDFIFYLVCYFILGSFSIAYSYLAYNPPLRTLTLIIFYYIFMPVFTYAVKASVDRFIQLHTDNKRLESVIKHEERSRISRDLHDNLGQSFSTITLKADLAVKLLEKDPSLARAHLQEIAQTSRENLNIVRSIVSNLNEKNIPETMMEVSNQLSLVNIYLVSTKESLAHKWTPKRQHVVSQVIQESINNVIRHSQATVVQIHFRPNSLSIYDNGRGLPKDYVEGNGIQGMKQRLKEIDGKLTIEDKNGIQIEVFLKEGDDSD